MDWVNDFVRLAIGPSGALVLATGFLAFLLAILWGLQKKWWVPGFVHSDLQARYDRLEARFNRVVDVATEGTRLSSLLVDRVVDPQDRPVAAPSIVRVRSRTIRRTRPGPP